MSRDLSGRKLGRYEVLAQLASGGMATVYVARAQGVAGFERLVAVKVLHPHLAHDEEFISMFLDEARLAARIRHPNVVPTLDISDTEGDGFFLVMDYIEGDHLGALLREAARKGMQLPPPIAARIIIDALEGLEAAHKLTDSDGTALEIVHRDVSPHNIMVGTDGVARITDFGVAKAEVRLSATRDGQFKGKLSYMAPEQATTGKCDQRSDLFSMGIVLWETLTGRRLFRADNNGELLNRLLNEPIVGPSKYTPEAAAFDDVCAKALERDPDKRFQTAGDFVDAIEEAAQKAGGVSSPRPLGKLVRELLGHKIEANITRIRASIDSLGHVSLRSGMTALPATVTQSDAGIGSTTSPSQPGQGRSPSLTPSGPSAVHRSVQRPLPPEDATSAAKPSTMQSSPQITIPAPDVQIDVPPEKGRNWVPIAIGGVALVVLLGVGGAAMTMMGEPPPSPEPSVPVAAPPEASASPAVEEPVAPTEPTQAVAEPAADPAAAAATPTEVTEPEVAAAPAAEEPEEEETEEPSARGSSSSRSRSRARGSSEQAATAPVESPPPAERPAAPPAERPAPPPSSEEDDLLLNPYRR